MYSSQLCSDIYEINIEGHIHLKTNSLKDLNLTKAHGSNPILVSGRAWNRRYKYSHIDIQVRAQLRENDILLTAQVKKIFFSKI
jgi:hypothetical protein